MPTVSPFLVKEFVHPRITDTSHTITHRLSSSAFTKAIRSFLLVFFLCPLSTWGVVYACTTFDPPSITWLRLHTEAISEISSTFYADVLRSQLHSHNETDRSYTFTTPRLVTFVLALATNVHLGDVRTVINHALAGRQGELNWVIVQGIGTNAQDYPVEIGPAQDLQLNTPSDPPVIPDAPETIPPPVPTKKTHPPQPTQEIPDKSIMIYHSHPHESFLPELANVQESDRAFAPIQSGRTVTSLGKHLAITLQAQGIGALHSQRDYPWASAYAQSRTTVVEAMATHERLTFFIDIHRDSARKAKTTLTHEGKTYAKLYFVVGQKNAAYEKNLAFAQQIHQKMEEKITGISRGIVLKKEGSNGEFNQSLSPNSVIVEVGGVDNTLQEGKRTVDVLGEVLAALYWEQTEAIPVQGGGS
jgi:stage II sporulation protein P